MPANPLEYRSIGISLRLSDFQKLEDWRREQPEIPSRAGAIQKWVLQGLKAATDAPPAKRRSASSSDDVRHPNVTAA